MNLCDHPVKDVLDIGTGSGILALMLPSDFQLRKCAVELEPDAAKQAHENAEGSPFRTESRCTSGRFKDGRKRRFGRLQSRSSRITKVQTASATWRGTMTPCHCLHCSTLSKPVLNARASLPCLSRGPCR